MPDYSTPGKQIPRTPRRWFLIAASATTLLGLLGVSACMLYMPGSSYRGRPAAFEPHEIRAAERMRKHVQVLAGKIGERNVYHYGALKAAAEYIEQEFRVLGYRVERQSYRADGKLVWNIIAVPARAAPFVKGTSKREVVIVGAHYDSVSGSPGADDNASGVAVMLEIARKLAHSQNGGNVQNRDKKPPSLSKASLRFVAFVNEEPPFFQTESMGSLVYARSLRARGVPVRGMLSLETMGYYSDAKDSQDYPFPFSLFFPAVGNFIGFVGDGDSSSLVRRSIGVFRRSVRFPSEGVTVTDSIPGIGWSDHWSFSQVGYQGVMITDTAPFRNPHYHLESDLPNVINYERMARVMVGLVNVVGKLLTQEL